MQVYYCGYHGRVEAEPGRVTCRALRWDGEKLVYCGRALVPSRGASDVKR